MHELSAKDRAIVEGVTADAKARGPQQTERAAKIHRAALDRDLAERRRCFDRIEQLDRAIAMRGLALRLLAEP